MTELSNYAVCYEAIQRVYRNAVIRAARHALEGAYGGTWLSEVERVFAKEWRPVVDAAREIREAGSLDASLVDDFDCLGVNHFHNLFGAFFDDLFPRAPDIRDNVRNEERRAVLRFASEVNDYRNAMSHPAEHDLPERDARRLLDSAHRLLRKIDQSAAQQILEYEHQLNRGIGTPVFSAGPRALTPADPSVTGTPQKFTETQRAHHEFFSRVLEHIKARSPDFTKVQRAGYDSWLALALGRSGFGLHSAIFARNRLRIEIYISTGDARKNKRAFDSLHNEKGAIEKALGQALEWERLDSGKDSRISAVYPAPVNPGNAPEEVIKWAAHTNIKFRDVFGPRIRELTLDPPGLRVIS